MSLEKAGNKFFGGQYTDVEDAIEIGYLQGKEDAIREIESKMYVQCFEKDNPEDMQKWDSGNWIRYKLFENVIEQIKEQDSDLSGSNRNY